MNSSAGGVVDSDAFALHLWHVVAGESESINVSELDAAGRATYQKDGQHDPLVDLISKGMSQLGSFSIDDGSPDSEKQARLVCFNKLSMSGTPPALRALFLSPTGTASRHRIDA